MLSTGTGGGQDEALPPLAGGGAEEEEQLSLGKSQQPGVQPGLGGRHTLPFPGNLAPRGRLWLLLAHLPAGSP